MPTTGKKQPVSLYFHIPFCTKKCPYCHFFVIPNREDHQQMYMEALEKEWKLVHLQIKEMEIVSIYFGGGTPSLLGPGRIATILGWIKDSSIAISHDCEITLEVNPENASLPLMQKFKESGVNRVSLGLQSLDDSLLQVLGRTHSSNKSIEAVETTYRAGITNISVDLMFELPHQQLSMWEATLKSVQKLPITHVSLYNLVIEPHTVFHKQEKKLTPHIPSPEVCKEMLQRAVKLLEEAGLKRYEISAFARPGYESRHNMGYWTARPFLGLGPSAFSYFKGRRFRNIANLQKYYDSLQQDNLPIDFEEKLPYPENIQELLAVEIRLLKGVDLKDFERRHAPLTKEMLKALERLENKGWIRQENGRVHLTEEGLLFYDSVAEEIV